MALTWAKYTVIPEGSEGDYPESTARKMMDAGSSPA